jgi:hypothetical protein
VAIAGKNISKQTELRPYHQELYNSWGDFVDYDGGGQTWGVTGWALTALTRCSALWARMIPDP